jgi:hypothetical protein
VKQEENLLLDPEDRAVPPKRRFTLNGLPGAVSQKTQLLIGIALRTSSPVGFGSNLLLQVFLLKAGSIGDDKSNLLSILGSLTAPSLHQIMKRWVNFKGSARWWPS